MALRKFDLPLPLIPTRILTSGLSSIVVGCLKLKKFCYFRNHKLFSEISYCIYFFCLILTMKDYLNKIIEEE